MKKKNQRHELLLSLSLILPVLEAYLYYLFLSLLTFENPYDSNAVNWPQLFKD